jgi:DNA-binding response OmpR family regulator
MYGDVNTVAVHISRLREKIEKVPNEPEHLQTVWGAGYRFLA